jgi:hypothetical protein
MDPNIVNSASFGLQWKVPFNSLEQVSMNHSPYKFREKEV